MSIRLKKILSYLLIAQTIYVVLFILAHIIAAPYISYFWHGEMTVHFLHYEMALLPFLIASLIVRKFKKIAFIFLIICAVVTLSLYKKNHIRSSYSKILSRINNNQLLQVICYNGNSANQTKRKFMNWLKANHNFSLPTLFVLIEANDDWGTALRDIAKDLPKKIFLLREDNFGIYLASNLDLSQVKIEDLSTEGLPAVLGEIVFNNKKLSFGAAHPFPPISNYGYMEREEYLKSFKQWLTKKNQPSIVCGDFNTTAWTASYKKFTSSPLPLKDTFWGPMRPITWGVLFLHTSIDFVFHSQDFETLYSEVGPKLGSDHHSLTTLLRWK